jgi:uncharacterized membrane protein
MKNARGVTLAAAVVVMLLLPVLPAATGQEGSAGIGADRTWERPPMLRLKCGSFDPLKSTPPIPDGLMLPVSQGVYIVQFDGPIYNEQTAQLGQFADVLAYIPDYAYAVRADERNMGAIRALDHVRYVGLFEPGYKISPELRLGETPRELTILCFRGEDIPRAAADIAALGAEIEFQDPLAIRARAPGSMALRMAFLSEVQWIEEYHPPQIDNGNAARISKVRSSTDGAYNWGTASLWSYNPSTGRYEGYAGANFTAAVADTGIDGTHPAFNTTSGYNKKVAYYGYGYSSWHDYGDQIWPYFSHGTHTAGTVAGNGAWRTTDPGTVGRYAGMAPLAGIVGQLYLGDCTIYDLCHDAVASGASVSSNSWGAGDFAVYDAVASEYDYMVRDSREDQPGNQSLTICFSAGNAGSGAGTVSSPATGKNILSVGAIDDSSGNSVADFSSRGPCSDGRIKPDIVAPGVNVMSCRGNSASSYIAGSGTSMSCPVVAGASLIVCEYYCVTRGSVPSPSMVKNILINGADAMSGYPYPGSAQGWGRLNLAKSLLNTTNRKIWAEDQTHPLSTGTAQNYIFNVTASTELKISLVWTDVNGTPNANPALVNDLDLRVTAPNGTIYFGNFFNNSYSDVNGTPDWKNNVEVARLAAPSLGQWRVSVKGRNVPFGPQDYSLVIGGAVSNVTLVSVNLAAEGLGASPADPAEGDLVTFSATVSNLGDLPEQAVGCRFTLTDSYGMVKSLGADQLPVLPVGESQSVNVNWTALRGCYTVALEVDPFSMVAEDRVDDNVASMGLKVRGYGLELKAPVPDILADPGRSNDFQLILSNRANTADNFTLSVDSPLPEGWTAGTQSASLTVPEGENSTFHAFVAPPADAWAGNETKLRIRATSQGNGTYTATVDLAVTVNQLFGVNVTAGAADLWVYPGVIAVFPVAVDNTGNGKDAISLSLFGIPLGWLAYLSESYIIVPPFSSTNVSMTVVPPSNAPGLSRALIDIRADFDTGRTATTTVTIHVIGVSRLELELADGPETEDPGGNASYVLRVKNHGNMADPFVMNSDLPEGWTGEFSGMLPLAAGDFELVDFILSVPADAPAGEQEFSLTAVSGTNSSVATELQLVIEVNQVYGVELSSDQTRIGLETGNSSRIDATVNNTGNGDDMILFESEDSLPAGWRITFMPPLVKLPSGGMTTILIKVRPPSNATEGSYFFSVRATSSGNSLKAASVRFRIDLANPPPEPVILAVNNTRPPQYTGPPPSPPPDRLTTWLRSFWFLPLALVVLVVASVAAVGVFRSRRKKRLLAEEWTEPPRGEYDRFDYREPAMEPTEMLEVETEAKAALATEPPLVAPPEPVEEQVAPLLSSKEDEAEIEVIDMGPPIPAPAIKSPPPARPAARSPSRPQKAALGPAAFKKKVDSDIDDILSRIDSISKNR